MLRLATYDEAAAAARKAADPMLAKPMPTGDELAFQEYQRHLADAEGGPELRAVVARLEALVEAVPPAEWETTYVEDSPPTAYRIGVKSGHSFKIELPLGDTFEALAKDAESADPHFGRADVIDYFVDHRDGLAAERPAVLAVYDRMLAAAKTSDDRDMLLDQAREYARKLHVPPP